MTLRSIKLAITCSPRAAGAWASLAATLPAVLLLLAAPSTSVSASPITILSVTGGTPGVSPGIFPPGGPSGGQTVAISFTVGRSYSGVSISPGLDGGFDGIAYLTTQIGAGTTVEDVVASSPFVFPAAGVSSPGFQTVLQDVSIDPGTYFLVLASTATGPAGVAGLDTSTDPTTIADVGASTPFGTYVSTGAPQNAFAPSDNFVFLPVFNGSHTTPEFIITGQTSAAVPEPATLALLASGLLGFGAIGWRRRVVKKSRRSRKVGKCSGRIPTKPPFR